MIKVIAFDFVGVLVREKNIELTEVENNLERMFGPNFNDSDFLANAKKYINSESLLIKITEELIDKLYVVREQDLFKKTKEKFNNIKIIIASNHVSFIKNYIYKNLEIDYLDDIIISAEINKIKPNYNFYKYILDKYGIKPEELLFLDDNQNNIDSAKEMGINVIKVDRETNLFNSIINYINHN